MTVLLSLLCVSLWTAAWLYWCFHGEVRHFAVAYLFPEDWRAGREPAEIVLMDHDDLDMYLAAECAAPGIIRGVLGCYGCLSAHISAVGVLLSIISLGLPLFAAPLVWAGGAWVGHRLHHHLL